MYIMLTSYNTVKCTTISEKPEKLFVAEEKHVSENILEV